MLGRSFATVPCVVAHVEPVAPGEARADPVRIAGVEPKVHAPPDGPAFALGGGVVPIPRSEDDLPARGRERAEDQVER
jgi:hypothetical protein